MEAGLKRTTTGFAFLLIVLTTLAGVFACDDDSDDAGESASTPKEFIQSLAIELHTFDPSEPFDDLEGLETLFADKEIVLLGEGDHGIKEALEYKLRLIAYLYYELGFSVHAYEIGVGEGILIDEYLQTGDESKIDDLDIFDYQSFISTDEHVNFLKALRKLNEDRPSGAKPLRYYGFDLDHGKRNAMELVISYLNDAATEELMNSLSPLISCIDSTLTCADRQDTAINNYDAAKSALVDASSVAEFELHRGVLLNLADTVRYYAMMINQEPGSDSFREEAMMRNFDRLDADVVEKIILSAHNMHIARDLTAEGSGWWKMIGEHVVEARGEGSVYGLCMTFYQGTHLTRDSNWVFESEPIGAVPSSYLEVYLVQAEADRFVLDFTTSEPGDLASGWLHSKRGMLFNGYAGNFSITSAKQWDGVLFVKSVNASGL
jgi:erythromycin esterase-like protein